MTTPPDYSDAELEVQYNNQRRVPEHPAIMEDWMRRSAALRRRARCSLGLAYGGGERERIDVYHAERADAPLLVFVHGGYWQRGERSQYGFIAEGPLAHGFTVAVIGYGLCPRQAFTTITPQVTRAVAWLLGQGATLGFDPSAVHLSGHSAGGHLTAALLASDFSRIDDSLAPCPLAGALAISGVFDLAPLLPTSINTAVGLDAGTAARESPLRKAPAAGACPLVAAVGGDESAEFHRQSRELVAAWGRALPARYLEVPGANHFTVLEALADPAGALCAALRDLAASPGVEAR